MTGGAGAASNRVQPRVQPKLVELPPLPPGSFQQQRPFVNVTTLDGQLRLLHDGCQFVIRPSCQPGLLCQRFIFAQRVADDFVFERQKLAERARVALS